MDYCRRVPVDEDLYRDSPSTLTFDPDADPPFKSRRGLFKKKATSTSITSVLKRASSLSSGYDDSIDVRYNYCFSTTFLNLVTQL